MEEKSVVLKNRYLLIKAYSYTFDGSPTEAAGNLVQLATRQGYIQPGKTLAGNKLKTWGMQQNAPEWACKAAAFYLLSNGYVPDDDLQRACLNYYKEQISLD